LSTESNAPKRNGLPKKETNESLIEKRKKQTNEGLIEERNK
jgi:hypothetical protein